MFNSEDSFFMTKLMTEACYTLGISRDWTGYLLDLRVEYPLNVMSYEDGAEMDEGLWEGLLLMSWWEKKGSVRGRAPETASRTVGDWLEGNLTITCTKRTIVE